MGALTHTIREWAIRQLTRNMALSIEEFLRSLHLIIGLEQLLDTFSAKLQEIFDAGTVYVVLFEPITNRYVGRQAKGRAPEHLEALNFSRSDRLIKWLSVNRCPLDVRRAGGVIAFLSARERAALQRTDAVLVIPLIVFNRLTGVVVLSSKLNGEMYSLEEITLLSALADQSALAITYTLTYHTQEERLKKLFHADKLAMVGELAAGVAHEVRNPLATIRSTVQYVRNDLSNTKQALIDRVITEVDRINRIVEGLLSFSRMSEMQIAEISLEELLDQTLLLLEPELRQRNITVQRHTTLTDPRISADAAHLEQVFLNILLNSLQAMPHGGTITITTADLLSDVRPPHTRRERVCVTINDTGPGIPEHDLSRVFDPFYTTKATGTGLGLSVSYGIVSHHGGEIDIASTTEGPQTGTTVQIRLPRTRGRDEQRDRELEQDSRR